MKIISFDIGIKNMAYCIFDLNGENPIITSWDIINLTQPNIDDEKCNQNVKKSGCVCNKNAVFFKDDNYYCRTHSKKSGYESLENEIKLPQNISLTKLKELMVELKISINNNDRIVKTREDIKIEIIKYIEERYLNKIKKKKNRNTNDYDLIELGHRIKDEFNKVDDMNDVTHVLIENQISPIASRMKTIQGMVAQYFIMKFERINIEFISSSNKLKLFTQKKTDYKQHKIDAIYYCKDVLTKNTELSTHINTFNNSTKKDDMADSFLQGIWYIKTKINKTINLNI